MSGKALGWGSGDGLLDDWLRGLMLRFEASPDAFQIQRAGEKTWNFGGAGNASPYHQAIDNTYVTTTDALTSELIADGVDLVTVTATAPDHWSLRATPTGRPDLDWLNVIMPRASAWPLPAKLSNSQELHQLLDRLAGLLDLTPPDREPAAPERYPRPIGLEGTIGSSGYDLRVTGVGDQRLYLRGDTPQLLDRLRDLLSTQEVQRFPLHSLGELVHLCLTLEKDLGYPPNSSALAAPDLDVPLPANTHVDVIRQAGETPSFELTAGDLHVDASHPSLSLRERIALLLCPHLYTTCAATELETWLPPLEKEVLGRPGLWTVRGAQSWQPPLQRGLTTVLRALIDQDVSGHASVTQASAETITIQGLTLNGDPIQLAARTRRK